MKWPVASVSLVLGKEEEMSHPDSRVHSQGFQGSIIPVLRCLCHEVIIETALAFREPAANNVLILFGHLLLNIHFDSAQQKRSQNLKASN